MMVDGSPQPGSSFVDLSQDRGKLLVKMACTQSKLLHSICLKCFLAVGLAVPLGYSGNGLCLDRDPQDKEGDGDYQIGPDYTVDPDLKDRGNPKGKSFEFSMALADSKIFRGDDPTLQPEKKPVRQVRKIFVYVPAAYKDGHKAPLLIIHDGPGQLQGFWVLALERALGEQLEAVTGAGGHSFEDLSGGSPTAVQHGSQQGRA